MSSSCPHCGASVEFRGRTLEIQEASCSACGRASVVASPPSPDAQGAAAGAAALGVPSAPCWDCGAALTFAVLPGHRLEAHCESCGRETVLSVAAAGPGPSETGEEDGEEDDEEAEEESDDAPRRRPGPARRGPPRGGDRRPPFRRNAPPGGNARPCRQCGGVLSFEANEDGTTTGRCSSCGNTFTMHPRPEGARGGFARRPGWGGRPSGPPRYGDRPRRPYRRRDDDEDERPRRRRRDDD